MVTLEELMDTYPTVKGSRCCKCGNTWFFDKGTSLMCTTCYKDIKKKSGYKSTVTLTGTHLPSSLTIDI